MQPALLDAYNDNRDALLGFITKRVGDAQLSQDLLHDLYIKVQQQSSSQAILYPKAYLYRIANNLIIDHQRYQGKFADIDDKAFEQVSTISPEQIAEHKQRLEIVSDALEQLPAKTKAVFNLQRIQQLEKSQVASDLGISVNMVEKHLRRALQFCRDKLTKLEK